MRTLPRGSGVSLKPEHFANTQGLREENLWFEVHPENYFVQGGPRLSQLRSIAESFPISLHGIAASLAGPDLIPEDHLAALKTLCDQVDPVSVSEHFAWSYLNGRYLGNLLPAPRTSQVREIILANIDRMQTTLGRQILIENPAHYLAFSNDIEEPEFLQDIVQRSGCGWLLDLNNLYISEVNVGLNARAYLDRIDLNAVGEVHVAGHRKDPNDASLLIDSHDGPVATAVWELLDHLFQQAGPKPVLVEWDAELPTFERLLMEREVAEEKIQRARERYVA